jgi:dipeptidyl aminopeptidase/acylaminoacyl peptidase
MTDNAERAKLYEQLYTMARDAGAGVINITTEQRDYIATTLADATGKTTLQLTEEMNAGTATVYGKTIKVLT